jgi:hypothetical protein
LKADAPSPEIQISTDAKTKFQVKLRVDDVEVKSWADWAITECTNYLNQYASPSWLVDRSD